MKQYIYGVKGELLYSAEIPDALPLIAACERVLRAIEWGYTEDRMTQEDQADTLRAALAKVQS